MASGSKPPKADAEIPAGPDRASCPQAGPPGHPISERRLELEVVEPAHRLHVDALGLAVAQNLDRHGGAGLSPRPHLAVEIGKAVGRLAADAEQDIALLHAGPLRWAAARH